MKRTWLRWVQIVKPEAELLYNICTSSIIDSFGSSVIFSGALVPSARRVRAARVEDMEYAIVREEKEFARNGNNKWIGCLR